MSRSSEAARAIHEDVIAPVAEDFGARADEISGTLVERFVAELPEAFSDAESAAAARASTSASIGQIAHALREGVEPGSIDLPPETVAFTRDSARQGIPIAELLRTYRIGQALVWEMLVPALAERAENTDQLAVAINACAARVFAYVDIALLLAEDLYATERERFARTAAAVRSETIAALLDGSLADPGLAGRRLRHELDRSHVGLWAWLDRAPEAGDAYELLEAALVEFARSASLGDPLVQPMGIYAVAGWISATEPPEMAALAATRLPPEAFPGVLIALGEPGSGLAGFRSTHADATNARHVATLSGRSSGSVTRYRTVALRALASADSEHARRFVERELGPLAAGDDTALRLAATLRAYLDEHASRSRAANRLGVHENTVRYRVRQAEELLGRSVEEDTLNLRVALALAPVLSDHA